MINDDGCWQPPISPKQKALMDLCIGPRQKRFVLTSGPRRSSKTIGCEHIVAAKAWLTNRGRISVVSRSVSMGNDGGVWTDLTEGVLNKWIDAGFGMEWVTRPRQQGSTHKFYCEVSNIHGNKTHIQLDSLDYDRDVEQRFKNKNYSMIYVPELSFYKTRKTFDTWIECLRGSQWDGKDFLFLADTNPADDGQDSWIYKLWYLFQQQDKVDAKDRSFRDNLALLEIFIADNPFLSADQIELIHAQYRHSQDMWNRYVLGKWVRANEDGAFVDVFRPVHHLCGESPTPAEPEPVMMLPQEGCSELGVGWDLGDVNHAAMIVEPVTIERDGSEVTGFKVLDELVWIKHDGSIGDFAEAFVERMEFWERQIGRKIMWQHWSDRSAFDVREPISRLYHHQEVFAASRGRIRLLAAEKTAGSVRLKLNFLRRLLFENRIWINKTNCPHLVETLQGLPKGRQGVALPREHPLKHAFDALMYYVAARAFDEMEMAVRHVNSGQATAPGVLTMAL